jgi:hypothetical protein
MAVHPADAFGGLYKNKTDFDLLYLHIMHQVPVDIVLVVRYIDAMDAKIFGDADAELGIGNKIGRDIVIPPPQSIGYKDRHQGKQRILVFTIRFFLSTDCHRLVSSVANITAGGQMCCCGEVNKNGIKRKKIKKPGFPGAAL